MKKLLLIVQLILVYQFTLQAHDPALASFRIYQQEGQWQLRADFAWSLRNAVIKAYPFLAEENVTEAEFQGCILEYLEENISIRIDDQPLHIGSLYQVPGDHAHAYVFIALLEGPVAGSELKIENRCLFELYCRQQNNIILSLPKGEYNCQTRSSKPGCYFMIN